MYKLIKMPKFRDFGIFCFNPIDNCNTFVVFLKQLEKRGEYNGG